MTRTPVRSEVSRFLVLVLQNCLMVVIVLFVVYLSWVVTVHRGLAQSDQTGSTLVNNSKENSTKRVDDEDTTSDVDWTAIRTSPAPAFQIHNNKQRSDKLKTRNQERKRKRGRKRIRNRKRLNKKTFSNVETIEVFTGEAQRQADEETNVSDEDTNVVDEEANVAGEEASFAGEEANVAVEEANVADKKTNVAGRKQSSEGTTVTALSFKNVIKPLREDTVAGETKPGETDDTETKPVGTNDAETKSVKTDTEKTKSVKTDTEKTKSARRDASFKAKNINAVDRTKWSTWGACSITCGVGQQERVRSCGSQCQEIESKPCLSQPCTGNGDHKWMDKWAYFEMLDMTTDVDLDTKARDPCERWMKCSNKSIHHYLTKIAELPSCPCVYPVSLAFNDQLYDEDYQKNFVWEDASGSSERNDVYRPGATFCIRSLLPEHAFTLAAQHCCYDNRHRLITRGRDAGTPNLVSPQISRELHKKVDIMPWVICKGDWTRYDLVLNPNNKRQCVENPCMDVIREQVRQAKLY